MGPGRVISVKGATISQDWPTRVQEKDWLNGLLEAAEDLDAAEVVAMDLGRLTRNIRGRADSRGTTKGITTPDRASNAYLVGYRIHDFT